MLISKILTPMHRRLLRLNVSFSQVNKLEGQISSLRVCKMSNTDRISCVVIKNLYQTKYLNSHQTRSLTFKNVQTFCKSQTYVDHYNNLKSEIKEKQEKLKQLQEKLEMLKQMSETSTTDKLLQVLFMFFGQNYETKAFKQHKQILIDFRNILEKRIEESSVKWEEPRKLILGQRENKILQFIEAVIQYEGKMAEFIKKRESNKAQHLADVNEGLVLTHKLLIKNIEKEGGVQISPQKDHTFNEIEHQLVNVSTQVPKNAKINTLLMPGWKIKQRVVRKAKVSLN